MLKGTISLDHFKISSPLTVQAGTPFELTITAIDNTGKTLTNFSNTASAVSPMI